MRVFVTTLALVGACAVVCAAGQARADVIYSLSGTAPGELYPFVASFDLTDAQVQTGAFNLTAQGSGYNSGPYFTGDVRGFTSLQIGSDTLTPSYVYGNLSTFDLTFGATGNLGAVDVVWGGNNTDATITGTGASATANYNDDYPEICRTPMSLGGCTITGAFTRTSTSSVPEPASLAILGASVLGLAMIRRRAA